MAFFALTMVHGPGYDSSRPLRGQHGWDQHASFMDGLADDGFVILGGPIGDGGEVMLVVEAEDERDIRTRLGPDPWGPMGIIRIGAIRPWTIWLDGRHVSRAR
jgi:hypothetical protein